MANSQNLTSPHIAAMRVHSYLPILKTDCFTHSSSFDHQPALTPTIMGKTLKAPLGYVPTWVQMRRLESGQGPPKVGAFSSPPSRLRYLEEKRFRKGSNLGDREGEREKREKRERRESYPILLRS